MQSRATLGNRVREAREAKNLTQAGLAKKSGVGRATISLLERGAGYEPQGSAMRALAVALNVEFGWLWFVAEAA